MLDFVISASEDHERPEGGHAVVVVEGVPELSEPVRFRLTPRDPALATPAFETWHRPLSERSTDDGLVLVLGPEITESPLFVTGIEYVLSLETVDGSGILVWPSISPLIQVKRRTLLTRAAQRDDGAETRAAGPPPAAAVTSNASAAPPNRSDVAVVRSRAIAAASPASPPAAPFAAAADGFGSARSVAVATIGLTPEELQHGAEDGAAASVNRAGPSLARLLQNPLLVAGITAVALFGGQALLSSTPERSRSDRTATAGVARVMSPGQTSPNGIYDLLATGLQSPRGHAARTVSATRAMELAQQALQSAPDKDVAEAEFWLKRAAVTAQGQDRAARALTQLGTLHTEPRGGNAADYEKAHVLWEIAAALGDAGAAFFLGQIYEFGLGVAKDPGLALTWYGRAQAQGSFPGVEDALKRIATLQGQTPGPQQQKVGQ